MIQKKEDDPIKKLKGIKIIYPILIGLGVVGFMFYRELNKNSNNLTSADWAIFDFSTKMLFFLALAFVFMIMRDIGYMMRLRILTNKKLSWRQSFRVIMLWEFSSALMPSAFGGTAVAMFFINKEGINFGKSTAVVMATAFLDELYFIIMFPLLLLTINVSDLFSVSLRGAEAAGLSFANEFFWAAVVGYSMKFIFIVILSYGLFVNPRGLKWVLMGMFKLPFLRKFRYKAHITGTDIITSSRELRNKPFSFWLKAFGATFFSWSSRYLVANALLLAFFAVSDHLMLFARQLVISNMLLLSPTPGGSGIAELLFTTYLTDLIKLETAVPIAGAIAIILALVWRLVSYYPYLIAGAIIVPRWIKDKFHTEKQPKGK